VQENLFEEGSKAQKIQLEDMYEAVPDPVLRESEKRRRGIAARRE